MNNPTIALRQKHFDLRPGYSGEEARGHEARSPHGRADSQGQCGRRGRGTDSRFRDGGEGAVEGRDAR